MRRLPTVRLFTVTMPAFAARELMLAGWKGEQELWDTDVKGAFVEEEGLLTKSDIKRIEQEALLARERWLSSVT